MTDKIRKTLMAVALLAAFALGGAAVAGAVQGGGGNSNAAATTTQQQQQQQQDQSRPQRSDETLLTGETAQKVRAAALAEFPGATIERLETDGDGNAAYEAHMIKADGSRVTVYVNRDFEVVGSEEGHGRGHGGPRPDGDDDSDSQDSQQS